MAMNKNSASLTFGLLASSLLVACGGGGGGGSSGGGGVGGGTPPPTPVSFSPINGGNFVDIAAHAVSAGDRLLDSFANFSRTDNINLWVRIVIGSVANGVKLIPGTKIDVSRNCDLGGSMRITGQLVKAGTLDTGSILNIVADKCIDRKNVTRNGRLDMTMTADNGGAASVQFTAFTASEGNSNITVNGDSILDFRLGDTPASGTSLRVTETVAGKLFYDRTVSNYKLMADSSLFTRSVRDIAMNANFLLTTPELGNFKLTVRTIKPFRSLKNDGIIEIVDGTSSIVLTEGAGGSFKVEFHAKDSGPVTQSASSDYLDLTNK